MPLIKGKSDKAFKKNMDTEMKAGKPQDQSLAIAYNMKRKAKKKMAKGGEVLSAKYEDRPMPEQMDKDMEDADRVQSKKSLGPNSDWTGDSGRKAAGMGSMPSMKKPPTAKDADMRAMDEEEDDLMMHDAPRMADGGAILKELYDDEADMQRRLPASGPHGQMPKASYDEEHPMGSLPGALDHGKPHGMAHGGRSMKPLSISEAIMAKRRADKMADGGMVDLEENSEEMPNYYDELNEKAAGEPQYDDSQISPQPMDSNEHGDDLEDEDSHDMVSRIRARMKSRRGF